MFKPKIPTIIAVTALVVAVLGATPLGQAAGRLVLAKNSVGAAQLKKDAVTSVKIKNDQVTGADVKESSLGKVPSAGNADHAASADNATNASNAANASNATHATNATNATNASNATNAANAGNADKLDNIDSTGFARPGTEEAWHEIGSPGQPGFQNGWKNAGSGWSTAAFYKDPFDVVHLKGVITTGAVDVPIFTIPPAYRPSKDSCISTWRNTASAALCVVSATGSVQQEAGDSTATLLLDGITYRAG